MKRLMLLVLVLTGALHAQPLKLDMDVVARRRAAFMEKMAPGSIAIFPAKPELMRNLDVEYDYRQESNFYYLSGFEEPESVLLLAPSEPRYRMVLFVRKRNPAAETYEGPRAGIDGAMKDFRADTAYTTPEFDRVIGRYLGGDHPVYYSFGTDPSMDETIRKIVIEGRSGAVRPIMDPTPILADLRVIKTADDFTMGLQQAIDISAAAHVQACRTMHPGMYEYEIQAEFEYVYRKNGSPRNGYPCIIGSGPNATILHYSTNDRQVQNGDLVLMDCAAEYGYYSADITRTVPVNGRFTPEQRRIYGIVLDAQNAALRVIHPGVPKSSIDAAIDSVLSDGLFRLGFIKEKKDFHLFSLHGYSHWIGLEVHDVGAYEKEGKSVPLEPGMVFTLEPGLYIRPQILDQMKERGYTEGEVAKIRAVVQPFLNIGVRIEDDVLVTKDGCKNLSAPVPRDPDAIEALMKTPLEKR